MLQKSHLLSDVVVAIQCYQRLLHIFIIIIIIVIIIIIIIILIIIIMLPKRVSHNISTYQLYVGEGVI